MTTLPLTEIREALAKSTKGPWIFDGVGLWQDGAAVIYDEQVKGADASLIVLLRNNASAMLDTIDRLTRENEAYKEAMKEVEGINVGYTPGDHGHPVDDKWRSLRDAILENLQRKLGLT